MFQDEEDPSKKNLEKYNTMAKQFNLRHLTSPDNLQATFNIQQSPPTSPTCLHDEHKRFPWCNRGIAQLQRHAPVYPVERSYLSEYFHSQSMHHAPVSDLASPYLT